MTTRPALPHRWPVGSHQPFRLRVLPLAPHREAQEVDFLAVVGAVVAVVAGDSELPGEKSFKELSPFCLIKNTTRYLAHTGTLGKYP